MIKHSDRILSWAICFLTLAYLGGFVDLFFDYDRADTGWKLYSAFMASQGGPLDFLMTYRPGYLLNVPIIALFGMNLFALRLYAFRIVTGKQIGRAHV